MSRAFRFGLTGFWGALLGAWNLLFELISMLQKVCFGRRLVSRRVLYKGKYTHQSRGKLNHYCSSVWGSSLWPELLKLQPLNESVLNPLVLKHQKGSLDAPSCLQAAQVDASDSLVQGRKCTQDRNSRMVGWWAGTLKLRDVRISASDRNARRSSAPKA